MDEEEPEERRQDEPASAHDIAFAAPAVVFGHFRPLIATLPMHSPLAPDDLRAPAFRVGTAGRMEVYYVPFHRVNQDARLIVIGLTPGWTQMEEAYRTARDSLRAGRATAQVWEDVDQTASFAGTMRVNLTRMLDGIGVAARLGIASTEQLFGERAELVHTTSAVRDAVFINGRNYTGQSPSLLGSPLLRRYVEEILGPELERTPRALVVPLGAGATEATRHLVGRGRLDAGRCLFGFPHPSGANGHRVPQYEQRREAFTRQVAAWFGAGPVTT